MTLIEAYCKLFKKEFPYGGPQSIGRIVGRWVRAFMNAVIIPNIPSNRLRIFLYRLLGYEIGKNVLIAMKCFLDDEDPSNIRIEDNVNISYGTYFAAHGKRQDPTTILVKEGAFIGMRCNILSGQRGITIGRNAVIAAGSLVQSDIPDGATAFGVPARVFPFPKKPDSD